jgi:hypothetical protein
MEFVIMISPTSSVKPSPTYSNKNLANAYFDIFKDTSPSNLKAHALQQRLNSYYKRLMNEPIYFQSIPDDIDELADIRAIEDAWNRHLENGIKHAFPKSKKEFKTWYFSVNEDYKTAVKPFFDYFSQRASLEELALYLAFEQQIDGSFDDTVALAQIGLKGKAKMVLGENYWDEMGNGNEKDVHTIMFANSVNYLEAVLKKSRPDINIANHIPTEALANGNMLMMYANRRKYIPRLLGAIGILEDTAPDRFKCTVTLMKRYNLSEEVLRYHEVHVCCDCRHGEDILDHVLIASVMQGDQEYLHEVCKGVVIRLNVAIDYYKSLERCFKTLFN